MSMVAVLLVVAGVVLLVALHILVILWAVRGGVALRPRPRGEARDDDEERARGLTDGELGALPCQDFKPAAAAAADAGTGGECAVCLEAFQAGDRCRVLPSCRHGFHAQCVDSWLRMSRICPVCRAEVAGRGKVAADEGDEAAASSVIVGAERFAGADP